MAGIAQLFAEVEELLLTAYPKLQRGFGTQDLDKQTSPPRIVWVIVSAKHLPAEKVSRRPRSIQTRRVEILVHIWGKDLAQLEALVEDTMSALHRKCHGSLEFGGEQWITDDVAHRGMAALLNVAISGPVLERRFRVENREADTAGATANVTAIEADTSTSAPGDGAIDWNE